MEAPFDWLPATFYDEKMIKSLVCLFNSINNSIYISSFKR